MIWNAIWNLQFRRLFLRCGIWNLKCIYFSPARRLGMSSISGEATFAFRRFLNLHCKQVVLTKMTADHISESRIESRISYCLPNGLPSTCHQCIAQLNFCDNPGLSPKSVHLFPKSFYECERQLDEYVGRHLQKCLRRHTSAYHRQ